MKTIKQQVQRECGIDESLITMQRRKYVNSQRHKPANEIFQDRAFPSTLSADHSDLREVQITTLANSAESVLKFVDQGDQVFHPPVPHGFVWLDQSLNTNQRLARKS